jgi:hypothetical protein
MGSMASGSKTLDDKDGRQLGYCGSIPEALRAFDDHG